MFKHPMWYYTMIVPICLILWAGSAEAVTVKNLDKVTHRISISYGTNQEETTAEIPPNGIYRTYGGPSVTVKIIGKPGDGVRGRYWDELAIWPEGKLGIQKRRWPGGRTNY